MLVEEDLCDDPRSVFLSAAQRPEPQSLRLVERRRGGRRQAPACAHLPRAGYRAVPSAAWPLRRWEYLCHRKKMQQIRDFFFFLESLLLNVYLAACHCQSSFLTSCTRPPPTQLPSRHRRVSPRGCSRRSWREPVVFLSFFFFLLFFFLVSFSWKKTAVVAVKILSIAKASSSRPCPGPSCKQGATYFSVQLHFRGP